MYEVEVNPHMLGASMKDRIGREIRGVNVVAPLEWCLCSGNSKFFWERLYSTSLLERAIVAYLQQLQEMRLGPKKIQ